MIGPMPGKVAQSERLYLRLIGPEDIDEPFAGMFEGLEGKSRYFRLSGKPFTRTELVDFCRDGLEQGNVFYYGIHAIADDALLGAVRIGPIDFRNSIADMPTLIGDVANRGRGFGTEAIRLGNEVAFRAHKLRKLSGGVLEPNIASLAAYRRAGWIEEGRLRAHYLVDGETVDWIIISCFNPDDRTTAPIR